MTYDRKDLNDVSLCNSCHCCLAMLNSERKAAFGKLPSSTHAYISFKRLSWICLSLSQKNGTAHKSSSTLTTPSLPRRQKCPDRRAYVTWDDMSIWWSMMKSHDFAVYEFRRSYRSSMSSFTSASLSAWSSFTRIANLDKALDKHRQMKQNQHEDSPCIVLG